MIIADFKDLDLYSSLSLNLKKAFEYIKNFDKQNIADGKYAIEGDDIYAVVSSYNTKDEENSKFEIHNKYLDIQCILEGEEFIYVTNKDSLNFIDEYDEITDKHHLDGSLKQVCVRLKPNTALILFANDAHKACCKIEKSMPVRKLLIKVKI